jgi:hypothetical protein
MAEYAKVKEVADWFNKLVADGKGEYEVSVDDNMGGEYSLFKGDRFGTVFDDQKFVSIGDFNNYGAVKK